MSVPISKQSGVETLCKSMESLPPALCPVIHRFTTGLYVREVCIPKGSLVVSHTHKTEHPFVISQGKVSVWSESGGVQHLEAPYTGITKAGTQRVVYAHQDCIWTTFHATTETDPETIGKSILEPFKSIEVESSVVNILKGESACLG